MEAAQRFVQQGNPFSVLMEGEPWLRCHTDIGLTSVTMVCPTVAHASPDGGRVLVSKDAVLRDPGGPAASSLAVDVTEEEVLLAALDEAQWARNTDASACAEAADGHSALATREAAGRGHPHDKERRKRSRRVQSIALCEILGLPYWASTAPPPSSQRKRDKKPTAALQARPNC